MERYPGILSFTAEQSQLFNGRDKEIKELFQLVALHKMVVLFAKSGIGKTSLLQAGVCPLLQNEKLHPVIIRLNVTSKTPQRQVYEQLKEKECLDNDPPNNLTLWQYLKLFWYVDAGELQTPVLVFDQFEELFTLYAENEREEFVKQLADLANGRMPDHLQQALKAELKSQNPPSPEQAAQREMPPKVKLVISIRSDYLYLLDELSDRIPAIMRCRYQLLPLNENNAKIAIEKPANEPENLAENIKFDSKIFKYSAATLKNIIDSLGETQQKFQNKEIEAFQLQLLCQYIEKKIISENKPQNFTVAPDFYGGREGIKKILKEFYINLIDSLSPGQQNKVQQLVEEGLIRNERRNILEQNVIEADYGLDFQILKRLTDERLLRKEPRMGSSYYEISHDTLIEPILKNYKIRKEKEEKQKRRKAYIRMVFTGLLSLVMLFGAAYLLLDALKQRKLADETREAARQATEKVVKLLLEQAKQQILTLDYTTAEQSILEAAKLSELSDSVKPYLMELAFWHNEGNDSAEARQLLQEVLQLQPDTATIQAPQGKQAISAALKQLNSTHYDTLTNRYYPVMIKVPAGQFMMGADTLLHQKLDMKWNKMELPQHPVRLSAYQLAQTEVTVWQFALYSRASYSVDSLEMENILEGCSGREGNNPVAVGWYEAVQYCNWLSQRQDKPLAYTINKKGDDERRWTAGLNINTKSGYRLPTEAEWEYAARAGVDTLLYAGSNNIDSVACWRDNSGRRPQAVKKRMRNPYGFYDMSGNVWEWCNDWYDENYYGNSPEENPTGGLKGLYRVLRGGSWYNSAKGCRIAFRNRNEPSERNSGYGFRPACCSEE